MKQDLEFISEVSWLPKSDLILVFVFVLFQKVQSNMHTFRAPDSFDLYVLKTHV